MYLGSIPCFSVAQAFTPGDESQRRRFLFAIFPLRGKWQRGNGCFLLSFPGVNAWATERE
jgi:hypothetical protein